jgi:carboxyl-terminal processing protease
MSNKLARALLLVSGIALLPATTAALAAVDLGANKEIERFLVVYEQVREQYVDRPNDESLIKGAIEGMVSSLDPHSAYVEASDLKAMTGADAGSQGSTGLALILDQGTPRIIAPEKGGPAERAGLKPGDFIAQIDGAFINGVTLDDVVRQLRGPVGSTIKLSIARIGRDKPFDVVLTRAIVPQRSVDWEMKDGVAVLTISKFSQSTVNEVRSAMSSISKASATPPKGVLIDLRSNPGGLLDSAVATTDLFLPAGEIATLRGRGDAQTQRFDARPDDLARGLPIIVLIDAGTASGAEIFAAALQDNKRALVLGERSFGMGSVQTLIPLSSAGAIRLTTSRYFSPSGEKIQGKGLQPDITVPQLSDADRKTRPKVREADLRKHLLSLGKVDDDVLESDDNPDPRFNQTYEALKVKGVTDFQKHYAVGVIARLQSAGAGPTRSR